MNVLVRNICKPPLGFLITTTIGIVIGLSLIATNVLIHSHLSQVIKEENKSGHFIIVNKEINFLNTLFLSSPKITDEDINQLKSVESIIDIGRVNSNTFDIQATLGGTLGLITDFFVESVPDKFLDYQSSSWKWEESDKSVPIILSKDLYNLYNFSFAPSRGLPQLSLGTLDKITVALKIKGKGKSKTMHARIIGLSDRINSILVPNDFLLFHNKEYGRDKSNHSRALLHVTNPSDPSFQSALKDLNLTTKADLFDLGKGIDLLTKIIYFLLFIGVALLFYTLLFNLCNLEKLLLKKSNELTILIHLGYAPKQLLTIYIKSLAIQFSLVIITCMILVLFLEKKINILLDGMGYSPNPYSLLISEVSMIGILVTGFLITYIKIKQKLYAIV